MKSKAATTLKSFALTRGLRAIQTRALNLASIVRFRVCHLKLCGMRVGRIREWLAVLEANNRDVGWRGWWMMVRLAAGSMLRGKNVQAAPDYWRCIRCPLHDRALKRCGDDSGILGCGCFTVYAVAAGKPCWGRENIPNFAPLGYD